MLVGPTSPSARTRRHSGGGTRPGDANISSKPGSDTAEEACVRFLTRSLQHNWSTGQSTRPDITGPPPGSSPGAIILVPGSFVCKERSDSVDTVASFLG